MNTFENMQKLAFGKVLVTESTKMTKKQFKEQIREMILDEAKKKKGEEEEPADVAPQEDTEAPATEMPTDTMAPASTDASDIDPNVKNIQDLLQKAFVSAKQLGDEKLMNQIGNTITMLVRTQVLGGMQNVAENLDEENFRGKENKFLISIASRLKKAHKTQDWELVNEIIKDLADTGFFGG